MGDYDSEVYRILNDTYNEVYGIKENVKEMNKLVKELIVEIRGLREDLHKH